MNGLSAYKRLNNYVGWSIFWFALFVFVSTMEKSASFWDCGEFISGAYKLEVVHPPGAPFFILLGRIFSLFAPSVEYVPVMVNALSALSTAFVVLFCFWSTTAIVKKLLLPSEQDYNTSNILVTIGAGIVAALSCTFLDSLWFSATEGEVYALSMFFMTFIVWAILKWEADESKHADRWLLLIAFIIGLSTGVHLLSMLAIPFAVSVYYFKKYNPSLQGFAIAFGISFLIIGVIMKGIIAGIPLIHSKTDLFFVNSLNLPFNSGVLVSSILMLAALAGALFWSYSAKRHMIHRILLGLTFLLIGYSTFIMVPIRAVANPPINMNRPTDPFKMLSYLNREQYGERPLLYGPAYTADQYDFKGYGTGNIEQTKPKKKYGKIGDRYEIIDVKSDYVFDDRVMMFFPRLGFWQEASKLSGYRAWLNPDYHIWDRENKSIIHTFPHGELETAKAYVAQYNQENTSRYGSMRYAVKDDISWGDNIRYFFQYQLGYMYMRYFMWNFSGKQNDIQGTFSNSEGNWITGIPFVDEHVSLWKNENWPQYNLSKSRKNNKARNTFFAIPFILGLIGVFWLFQSERKTAFTILIMFLTTGLIFMIYSNQPPIEPRERDYVLAGSFFVYCMWIGMAVVGIYKSLSFLPKNSAAVLSVVFCLSAPLLMGTQGWDDHNRSNRTTTVDFAINYLESCDENAIIFTQGDNDTYPLWYAQEVEGVRTDVRVVNLSLLGVDWYINQLRYKMNDAPPVQLTFTADMIRGSNRDYISHEPGLNDVLNVNVSSNKYYEAKDIMKFMSKDIELLKQKPQYKDRPYYLPTRKLRFTIDSSEVYALDMIKKDSTIQIDEINVDLKKGTLLKNDLLAIDIIANNIDTRPIYFAVSVAPSSYLGFERYFQQEGLTYRIVPVENTQGSSTSSPVRSDKMYDNMMDKFKWGNISVEGYTEYTVQSGESLDSIAKDMDISAISLALANPDKDFTEGEVVSIPQFPNNYLDENIHRMALNLVSNFSRLAETLIREGEYEKAEEVLDKCLTALPPEKIYFNFFHASFPESYLRCGNEYKAKLLTNDLRIASKDELDYLVFAYNTQLEKIRYNQNALNQLAQGAFVERTDARQYLYMLQQLQLSSLQFDADLSGAIESDLKKYSSALTNVSAAY